MGEISLAGGVAEPLSTEESETGEWFQVEEDPDEDPEIVGMPFIENLFSVVPSTLMNEERTIDDTSVVRGSDSKSSSSSSDDTIMELPFMPRTKPMGEPTQLETPPTSSRQGSEQPK